MFDKLAHPDDVRRVEGHIPIAHRYTPGVAGTAFFKELREGRFVAARCDACGTTYCPPRIFCERDFEALEIDVKVGPKGTLESFTVGYTGLEGEPLDEPVVVGLVKLDGADTVLLHFLVGGGEPEIGARVEPVFKPKGKREGTILDLEGFKLAR